VFPASSIKVAEAAKVIENTQRDLNIALMNELAVIFKRMNIDTNEVIEAAGSKWNFLKFRPGLVGGHCIGVDPYYLTHKAEKLGYIPQVILAGRRINDGMAAFCAQEFVKKLIQNGAAIKGQTVVVFGLTFKENCPDIRNSKVADLVYELQSFGLNVVVTDPHAENAESLHEYGIGITPYNQLPNNAIGAVLAVAHTEYIAASPADLLACLQPGAVIADIKSGLNANDVISLGYQLWRL
jgi:UDP-N-acetyl-D-galactosamine dehydrogenase